VAGESLPLVSRRIPNALYAFTWYLVKTIWPTDLHPAHTYFGVVHPAWLVTLCGAGLLATFTIAVLAARRHPAVAVGLAWFAAALVPVIGLVPVGVQSHSDRFAYIPHIGLFIAMVWGGLAILSRWPTSPWLPTAVLVATLVAYVPLDRRQIAVWKDSETLWQHVLAIEPENAFACNNLAVALHDAGRSTEALPYLKRSVTHLPQNELHRANLEKLEKMLLGTGTAGPSTTPPTP